jgi:signal transduction histidine kinase
MSPEVLARLFQPFRQADETTSRRFGGTGLGLAITAQLVKLMEGTIHVSSEPGRGSHFTVRVRAQASSAPLVGAPVGRVAEAHLERARRQRTLRIGQL